MNDSDGSDDYQASSSLGEDKHGTCLLGRERKEIDKLDYIFLPFS